jgi:hypothetical protein
MAVNRVGSLVIARPAMTEITGSSSIRVMTCPGLRSILIGKTGIEGRLAKFASRIGSYVCKVNLYRRLA